MIEKISITSLIELKSITKGFNGKNIISQFNLNINNKQFLTILGPSGCGKTTILRLISGLDYVDDGKIFLEGQDITDVPAQKRHINTVFQNYALFPHMSVFDNIAFGLRMQKKTAQEIKIKVEETLQMVQLENFIKQYPHQLSGGQRQRVAIARAVINKPKVLLLDESLSSLDYQLRKKMHSELKFLQRKLGITFIYVTHNQEEALSMSDRIVIIRDGRIEQDSSPKDIYENPKNLFVAQFIGEINIFDAICLHRIDEKRIRANIDGYECNLYTEQLISKGQLLKILLRPEDLRIKKIDNKQKSLGIIGCIRDRNYKGIMIDTEIEINNGKKVIVSEFFNKNKKTHNYQLAQKICVTWIEHSEVVFINEN
ncbi:spermidine/putrescine ABC transporter ATP-binding protein PotA [Arsenophonus endosymbiont of Lipoptena cervi]|uniref:spermidine/putrescine ABC transporter ATP-binding protein PotA n=1 Tax=Arsenophonus endosymbiont of Lipoptena cervi TaxID=363258 RepID=UPI00376ED582